ncbi:MAG: hypothetical protein HQ523_11800 [Lentisphaerae bacterium]|nr:hypothetical protein [Lentisphaerota bacterium]
MKESAKPVRKCHACLLNQGDRCWLYLYPRGQWRQGRRCAALDDESLHARFRTWQKQPSVKTRRELRQEFSRTKKKDGVRAATRG